MASRPVPGLVEIEHISSSCTESINETRRNFADAYHQNLEKFPKYYPFCLEQNNERVMIKNFMMEGKSRSFLLCACDLTHRKPPVPRLFSFVTQFVSCCVCVCVCVPSPLPFSVLIVVCECLFCVQLACSFGVKS